MLNHDVTIYHISRSNICRWARSVSVVTPMVNTGRQTNVTSSVRVHRIMPRSGVGGSAGTMCSELLVSVNIIQILCNYFELTLYNKTQNCDKTVSNNVITRGGFRGW